MAALCDTLRASVYIWTLLSSSFLSLELEEERSGKKITVIHKRVKNGSKVQDCQLHMNMGYGRVVLRTVCL